MDGSLSTHLNDRVILVESFEVIIDLGFRHSLHYKNSKESIRRLLLLLTCNTTQCLNNVRQRLIHIA